MPTFHVCAGHFQFFKGKEKIWRIFNFIIIIKRIIIIAISKTIFLKHIDID